MSKKVFLITNSHIDPVWIWNRRSGRCSWINTMHSVIRMMERHPELKFTCSSSAQYRWIEENEPALFRKIATYVQEGRWEIVGGWEVQSDTIIAGAESLLRQGLVGKRYFRDKFGVNVKIGYCVDSFGHGAGLPKLLNAAGFEYFAAMRPCSDQMTLPPVFDWVADDGSAVRFLRISEFYNNSESSEEEFRQRVANHIKGSPLNNIALFFGVGDHGGGIYEEQIGWALRAADSYNVVFATLQEYFEAVKTENIPVVTGELGNCFRGCYSACHEVKRQIAYASHRILNAEKTGVDAKSLEEPWKELLFNHFHDILPGTCIMEAYRQDVYPGLGSVIHQVNTLVDRTLTRRTAATDTSFMTEGGLYIRNTEPHTLRAPVSVTGFGDPNKHGVLFNALKEKDGKTVPLQILPAPTMFGPCDLPWGDLTAVVNLAPNEEKYLAYAVEPQALPELGFDRQKKVLERLGFQMFHDDHGTWGFTLKEYMHPLDTAVLVKTEELADGPVASILRTNWQIRSSDIQADLFAYKDVPEIRIKLRIHWNEPGTCLKMTYNHGIEEHTFATGAAAGSVIRYQAGSIQKRICINGALKRRQENTGEVAMTDWCAAFEPGGNGAAFYSADLHGCDHADGLMRITLLRSIPFADHHPFPNNVQTGYQEIGMSFIELYLSEEEKMSVQTLPKRAAKCLNTPEVLEVTAHEADPAAYPAEAPCPFVNELPEVVTEAIRKNEAGKWEIHLMNHGPDTSLRLSSGKELPLPARKLTVFTL